MRIKCPEPFSFTVVGPTGPYTLHFEAIDEWDGDFLVDGLSISMTWSVLTIDRTKEGGLVFAGGTDGSEELWGDHFWYEARVEPGPPTVTLWGDQVIVRVDEAPER